MYTFFNKCNRSSLSCTVIALKFKMHWFQMKDTIEQESCQHIVAYIYLERSLIPDKDINSGGSFILCITLPNRWAAGPQFHVC